MKARKARARLQRRIAAYEAMQNNGPAGHNRVWVKPSPAKQGGDFVFIRPGSIKKKGK